MTPVIHFNLLISDWKHRCSIFHFHLTRRRHQNLLCSCIKLYRMHVLLSFYFLYRVRHISDEKYFVNNSLQPKFLRLYIFNNYFTNKSCDKCFANWHNASIRFFNNASCFIKSSCNIFRTFGIEQIWPKRQMCNARYL